MAARSEEEEEKLRENFYKSNALFVDIVAKTKRALVEHHLASARTTLPDFLNKNQHKLLHMCYENKLCSQCENVNPPRKTKHGLSSKQLETMFNKLGPSAKKTDDNVLEFCCFVAKENVTVDDLDITMLRVLLLNFCLETFWANCLSNNGKTLYDLLTEHKHDLYHLLPRRESCCCCDGNYALPGTSNEINEKQWYGLFPVKSMPPCAKTIFHDKPDDMNICVRKPRRTITPEDLFKMGLSSLILSRYCTLKKAIERLNDERNNVYAHAVREFLEDNEFDAILKRTSIEILTVAKVCNKEKETLDILEKLRNSPLNITEAERNRTFAVHELANNLEFREQILQAFQKYSKLTGKSISSIKEDIKYIRERVDSRYKKMFKMLNYGFQLILKSGHFRAGQFKSKANKMLDKNDPVLSYDIHAHTFQTTIQSEEYRETEEDTDTEDEEEENQFICCRCKNEFKSLDKFVRHRSKKCRKQIAGNGCGQTNLGEKNNLAKMTLSSKNSNMMHQVRQKSKEGGTSEVEILFDEKGCLILWMELASDLFESTDFFLDGIDKIFNKLFTNNLQEETEPIIVSLFITMVDGNEVKTYTEEDRLICGKCENVHASLNDFLRHGNKKCKCSFDIAKKTRKPTTKKVRFLSQYIIAISKSKIAIRSKMLEHQN
ncbi:unnamed protein product [Mytilus coruscus]|uniref:DZIP3-like HEPN domain-containing protein n=1 Tax=Mytilus coruscus TaxID=42192 RepID=A0A6J8EPA3_MYTCO|nr:unnamed protein product [Mytilus coruscus]